MPARALSRGRISDCCAADVDDRDDVALGILRRVGRRLAGFDADPVVRDRDLVVVLERHRRLQLDAVDVRAVVRAEILERPALAGPPQPRVLTRHAHVGHEDLAVAAAPDDVLAFAELVPPAGDRSRHEDQRGHLSSARYHGFPGIRPSPGRMLHKPPQAWFTSPVQALGNFIGGQFVPPSGRALVSRNPAADGAVVFETGFSIEAVHQAARAAAAAQPAWAALTPAQRARTSSGSRPRSPRRPTCSPTRSSSRPARFAAKPRPRSRRSSIASTS